jgi:hypothetical protein
MYNVTLLAHLALGASARHRLATGPAPVSGDSARRGGRRRRTGVVLGTFRLERDGKDRMTIYVRMRGKDGSTEEEPFV